MPGCSALLNNLTLKDLYCLKVLLDLKHISLAAEKLGCAQPNLSRSFKKMRDYFQDPLLVRAGRDMVLTPKALELKLLLQHLEGVLAGLAPDHFDPEYQNMEFTIAAPDFVVQNVLCDVLSMLYRQFSTVSFKLLNWNNYSKELLLSGDIHLAISLDNKFPANIYRRIIDHDLLVCVTSSAHPIAQKDELTVEDLHSFSHILVNTGGGWVDRMREKLENIGDLKFKLTVASYNAAFSVIEKSELISIVPLHVVNNSSGTENLRVHQLPFTQNKLEYGFCWHERFHNDSAHEWLRKALFPLMLNHPKQLASKQKKAQCIGSHYEEQSNYSC